MRFLFALMKTNISNLAHFLFKDFGRDVLLTNEYGSWIFLDKKDFNNLTKGKIADKLNSDLKQKGFLNPTKEEISKLAGRYLSMNRSVFQGPSLFIMILTLKCNHRCLYCQVDPQGERSKGFKMDENTAKRAVDIIFSSPSPFIGIEFQGGESLLNWPTLKYIVNYAKALNLTAKKNLKINLVTNLTLLDEKKLDFLLNNDVSLSCSFDGPAHIHNKNRIYLGPGNSYARVAPKIKMSQKKIASYKKKYKDKFVDRLNAILTVSKFSLPRHKEIVDEYVKKGFNNIFIRPLSYFGLKKEVAAAIGYKAEDFIEFYKKSMNYILGLNAKGKFFIERMTFHALIKILNNTDANFYEMRSPCGAGIGQMAFDYDGKVYTCDEGRMAARIGYDNFRLGDVQEGRFNEFIDNEITKTMCLSSILDNHAACQTCVYKPYCGTCPLANFIEYGNLFPRLTSTDRCKINKAMFDYIFEKLKHKKYKKIFENWLIAK